MKAGLAYAGRVFGICAAVAALSACSSVNLPSASPGQATSPAGHWGNARAKTLFIGSLIVPGKLVSVPADSDGKTKPLTTLTGSEERRFGKTYSIAYDRNRNRIWLTSCIDPHAEHQADPILAFDADASGDVKPVVEIFGDKTEMGGCQTGITIGANGAVYVADATSLPKHPGGQIVVFGPDQNGDVAPLRRIAGKNADFHTPESMELRGNNLYVADSCVGYGAVCHGYVQVFSRIASGDVPPIREIAGSETLMDQPFGLAIDSQNNIYISNETNIAVFRGDAKGNAKPLWTIEGGDTKLVEPGALAIDGADYVYVGNVSTDPTKVYPLLVFAPNSKGNTAPIASIDVDTMPWRAPSAVAVK